MIAIIELTSLTKPYNEWKTNVHIHIPFVDNRSVSNGHNRLMKLNLNSNVRKWKSNGREINCSDFFFIDLLRPDNEILVTRTNVWGRPVSIGLCDRLEFHR
ncbi:hypothetical protein BLOT_005423, partial [Blomia tropicalis]